MSNRLRQQCHERSLRTAVIGASVLLLGAAVDVTAQNRSVFGNAGRGAAKGAIIGGIAGDAGKGAAAGAVGGALFGNVTPRAGDPGTTPLGDTARGAAKGAIIGGIAGDAGKGAAAGAAGGLVFGSIRRQR